MRAITLCNARQYRPYAFFYALFCLVAAYFLPGKAQMKPWFEGKVARLSYRQAHS